ncbi:MAG: C69 family dipeptidase [Candidatus Aminicenantes bacterium]|nr:MAG: C69 family dipeptidase [Candidatus Aminicenantes bacterium]
MKRKIEISGIVFLMFVIMLFIGKKTSVSSTLTFDDRSSGEKCNVFMVGKLATIDGSVINTQTAGTTRAWFHPPADHEAEAKRLLKCYNEYDRSFMGEAYSPPVRAGRTIEIPEIRHTFAYIEGDWWPFMNEHQVSIGETTLGGLKKELFPSNNSDALLRVTDVTRVAVERAKTARDAIRIMASLMEEYGFNPWGPNSGEFISVADRDEVWAWEVIPVGADWKKSSGEPGAAWCAMRIPDDMFAPSCNESIIGEIDLDDKENFMASSNAKSLAVKYGFWEPRSDKPFRWDVAYWGKKANSLRTWRALSLIAPSLSLKPGNEEYPIPVRPDKKISILDIRRLYEDFYQGTEYDRTKGLAAGPFGCPWWPKGTPDMPITIPDATGPSIVILQGRNWLPDPLGGIMWVGLGGWGDACVYVPFYAGMTKLPKAYTTGVKTKFCWDSAYWIFNMLANWARLHYARMIGEIKNVQHVLETSALNKLGGIDDEAYSLYREDPALASEFLNETCIRHAEEVLDKWRELAAFLIAWYSHNSWFGDQVEAPAWWREVLQKDKN